MELLGEIRPRIRYPDSFNSVVREAGTNQYATGHAGSEVSTRRYRRDTTKRQRKLSLIGAAGKTTIRTILN